MNTPGAVTLAFIGAALGGVLAGSTIAAAQDESSTISACYSNYTGAVRIVTAEDGCRPDESAIEWDQHGAIGPAGPQGEPGEPGPAGPEGPAGGLSGRVVVTEAFTVPHSTADSTYVPSALCPPGTVVTGGGYEIEQAGVNEFRESRPMTAPEPEGWRLGVGLDEDVDVHGVVYAICASA